MQPSPAKTSTWVLTLAALGVVYGDIGTSPLYAMKEVFNGAHLTVTPENILGILSMFFWTLTVIVSIKYVGLVMRADNNGEGGLIAMLALASGALKDKPQTRRVLITVGIFGASLFYGDGVITPAISVLGAMEGLDIISPQLRNFVIPLTLIVLTLLFAVQKHGTARIGKYFGPVTLLWFLVIATLGVLQIADNPGVLRALSPTYALFFVFNHFRLAFLLLGAIVLCVTGAEALYADMGHFGKRPIRIAWFWIVMPSLALNYFGQGALLLANPKAVENPFYLLAPEWALLPLVVLATTAAVIASQALISGAYSMTKQVIQMKFLPRMQIDHTSVRDTGQIYMPFVNWCLYVAIVFAVLMFKNSGALASAYGIAVCTVMLITTVLTFYVVRFAWGYPLILCVLATSCFFAVDAVFLASNLLKLHDGGWFPLVIGGGIFLLMTTWQHGMALMRKAQKKDAFGLRDFLQSVFVSPPQRVEGTAVFLVPDSQSTPTALLHNLKHNKVLHEHNLFVTVQNREVPWIGLSERVESHSLGHHCWQITLYFGFKNDPDVPGSLRALQGLGFDWDDMNTSYFLSKNTVQPTEGLCGSEMAFWREKLFAVMYRNAVSAADFLQLPSNAVVELGAKVEI